MKEIHLFYSPDIEETLSLPDEEAAHAIRVLRMGVGDEIKVTDGRGKLFSANIVSCNKKSCQIEINERTEVEPSWYSGVHLAVAPTKMMDRMEWMTEKCTEIGVDTLTPLLCHYSERKVIRTDRLQKIILSAAKQSLSAYLPRLNELTTVQDCINHANEQHRYIAHSSPWLDKRDLRDELRRIADSGQQASGEQQSTIILIGPEGGFTDDEVRLAMEHGFIPVSLGDARLRTETAAIVACTMINYV